MNWRAMHFFIHDMNYHPVFLTAYLKPEIEQLKQDGYLNKFFYITYWQGGNHIRFRYISDFELEVKARLQNCFHQFLKSYQPTKVMEEATYYKQYANNKEQVKDLLWREDGQCLEIPYEPEYARYGGTEAIAYSENIFQCSSEYALDILEATNNNFSLKLYAALDMMGVTLGEVEEQEAFLEQYIMFWSTFNEDGGDNETIVKKLYEKYRNRYERTREGELEYYHTWKEQLHKNLAGAVMVQDTFPNIEQAKGLIMASLYHMNHNRMGIYPRFESILAKVLLLCVKGVGG